MYLDPSEPTAQKHSITVLSKRFDAKTPSLFAGDFNFVEYEYDRLIKQNGAWLIGVDEPVEKSGSNFVLNLV